MLRSCFSQMPAHAALKATIEPSALRLQVGEFLRVLVRLAGEGVRVVVTPINDVGCGTGLELYANKP